MLLTEHAFLMAVGNAVTFSLHVGEAHEQCMLPVAFLREQNIVTTRER